VKHNKKEIKEEPVPEPVSIPEPVVEAPAEKKMSDQTQEKI
jgi:hypothetical protein